uniref:Uncharacterized protein n=1 Tax=viral metagenome TaxID=1070528 RepID=A0A6M3J8V6_9ZZZZ
MITYTLTNKKAILENDIAIAINENTLHLNRFKINPIGKLINMDFIKGYINTIGEFVQTEDKLLSLEIKGVLYDEFMIMIKGAKLIDDIETAIIGKDLLKQKLGTTTQVKGG